MVGTNKVHASCKQSFNVDHSLDSVWHFILHSSLCLSLSRSYWVAWRGLHGPYRLRVYFGRGTLRGTVLRRPGRHLLPRSPSSGTFKFPRRPNQPSYFCSNLLIAVAGYRYSYSLPPPLFRFHLIQNTASCRVFRSCPPLVA